MQFSVGDFSKTNRFKEMAFFSLSLQIISGFLSFLNVTIFAWHKALYIPGFANLITGLFFCFLPFPLAPWCVGIMRFYDHLAYTAEREPRKKQ